MTVTELKNGETEGVLVQNIVCQPCADTRENSLESNISEKPSKKVGVSNIGAVCAILTTAVGVGMLALPNAIAQAGYVLGFTMFVICIGIALFCCDLQKRAMWYAMDIQARQDPSNPVKTYEDIGRVAYGRWGRLAVSIALHSALVGCACIIALLMGKAAFRLVPGISQTVWIIISCAIMLPFAWLRTMKHLGFVSATLGTASIFALTAIVVVAGIVYVNNEGPYDWIEGSPARVYSAGIDSIWGLGTTFGTLTFAFAVTCTLPTILYDMENKNDADKVIVAGVAATSFVYGTVGLCGYIGFGSLLIATGVDSIFSVLEKDSSIGIATDVIVLLVCITHYAVMLNPTSRVLEDSFEWSRNSPLRGSVVRTGLVVFTALIAIFCGQFTALVDLIGSISFACVHMVFPPLFYMKLRSMNGESNWTAVSEKAVSVSCVILVALAIMGGTIGSISSIKRFIES
jgi:amino acid permease